MIFSSLGCPLMLRLITTIKKMSAAILAKIPRVLTVSGTKELCVLPTIQPYDRSSSVHFLKCGKAHTFGTTFPSATKIFFDGCDAKFVGNWLNPWTFPVAQEIYLDSPITEMLKKKTFNHFLLPRSSGIDHRIQAKFYITTRQLGLINHPFPQNLCVASIDDYQFRSKLTSTKKELEENLS